MTRVRTVALVAREPGLAVLREALLTDPALELVPLYAPLARLAIGSVLAGRSIVGQERLGAG